MSGSKSYWVYILTNANRTLYTGVTGNLHGRIASHREGAGSTFTTRYGLNQLVYFERFDDVYSAIRREKQIKGWKRCKKTALIESVNPGWFDLWGDVTSSWS